MGRADDERSAGRRPRRRAGPTLLSALFGAGLLIVLGFALGIVAGLMLEEPQLLLDYVTGKTRSVALAPAARPAAFEAPAAEAPAPGAPDVAARAPGPPSPAPAAQATVPAPAPGEAPARQSEAIAAPATPPTDQASTDRGYSVQVGAFADSGPAAQLARRLESKGLPVYVSPSAGADARKWRVRVGPLATRDEADRVAARLEKQEKLPTWVMVEGTL